MKLNLKVENHGTMNIGENIENNYYNNEIKIIQELILLRDHCSKVDDKERIKEAIELLKRDDNQKAKKILVKLSKQAKDLIGQLSLTLIVEFLKEVLI